MKEALEKNLRCLKTCLGNSDRTQQLKGSQK